jgi:hypothetical protein
MLPAEALTSDGTRWTLLLEAWGPGGVVPWLRQSTIELMPLSIRLPTSRKLLDSSIRLAYISDIANCNITMRVFTSPIDASVERGVIRQYSISRLSHRNLTSLSNASNLLGQSAKVASGPLIAQVVSGFTGCLLLRKHLGLSLHHHEGLYATLTPTVSQVQPTYVKALTLTGCESTMTFIALCVATQRLSRDCEVLALLEQARLIRFDLN